MFHYFLPGRHSARRWLAPLLILAVILVTSWVTAFAAQRVGVFYAISLDLVASGGGAGASASYQQTDCVIGQEMDLGGRSNSGNYVELPGLTQLWPQTPKNAAKQWQNYH